METDARLIAIRYYRGSEREFAADLTALSANPDAIIIYLPQLVLLMKPADSRHPQQWDTLHHTPHGADAWYVHLLVGNMQQARQVAQRLTPRPWICFQRGARNTRPHIIRWERFTAPPCRINRQHRKNDNSWDS